MSDTPNTDSDQQRPSLLQSICSNAVLLGIFAVSCTAIITGTYLSTQENITKQKKQAELRALLEIVPKHKHNNDLLKSSINTHSDALGLRKDRPIYLAMLNGVAKTLIYPVTAREGYSGDIDFIVGVNVEDQTIAGVRVLSHKETPGLGDRIDLRKSPWITRFNGKSLVNPLIDQWRVKKDGGEFDAFTGATITPRAMIKATVKVLEHHDRSSQSYIDSIVNLNSESPINGNEDKHHE